MRSSGSSGAARTAASITTTSSAGGVASTASTRSSLDANQYSTVCLRTPTRAAISSSDTASTPRAPNRSSAASIDAIASCRPRAAASFIDRCRHGDHDRISLPNGRRDVLDMSTVIAESLAGKRIAITGSTGFVGTALVERLLRGVPDCELVLLVRDGKRTTAAERVAQGDPQERRLRPAARRAAGRRRVVRRDVRAADHDGRRRRQPRRARPRRRRPRRARRRATSSSTRRPPCRSTRRSTRRSRSTCSARRASPTCCNELGVTPHLVAVSTCYVAGNRRGNAPEELRQRRPVRPRPRLAQRGRRRPPAARRQPRRRAAQPDRLEQFRAEARSRARRRRRAGARREDRAAPRALGARTSSSRPAGRGRRASAGPTPTRSPRRSASRRSPTSQGRTCRSSIVRPSIIESALGRAAAGLDPRLPHGRAGDHLLRPRPAAASSPACPRARST